MIGSETPDYRANDACVENDYYFAYPKSTQLIKPFLMLNRKIKVRPYPPCRRFPENWNI